MFPMFAQINKVKVVLIHEETSEKTFFFYVCCHYTITILKNLVTIVNSLWTRCSIKIIHLQTFALTQPHIPTVCINSHFDRFPNAPLQWFILYKMAKMVTHIEARTFKISKLENLLEKPSNLLRSLESVIYQNCTCLREGKTSNYKVLGKLYDNGEFNCLVYFYLIF